MQKSSSKGNLTNASALSENTINQSKTNGSKTPVKKDNSNQ